MMMQAETEELHTGVSQGVLANHQKLGRQDRFFPLSFRRSILRTL